MGEEVVVACEGEGEGIEGEEQRPDLSVDLCAG